ncbi:hypothetical protein ABT344_00935 [Micromonospora carbonacea]|jgi:hypothetical protein|uniref:hypothetical protein n=1 Tax=Micromonospora carbonacea TaxID=47853 RepID=UPI00331EED3C
MHTTRTAEVSDGVNEPDGIDVPAGPVAAGWSQTVRTAAFGAGAAVLIGIASAMGPMAATLVDQPETVLAGPFQNTTCCVEE